MINLFIAGDIVPRDRTIELFKTFDVCTLFGSFLNDFSNSDYSIVNLEAPVVFRSGGPIKKDGPALHTTKETIETIKKAGFNALCLANNHFRDYGQTGVEDTISTALDNGMDIVGGGITKDSARKPLTVNINNSIVGIINVCEHEYSIATDEYGGSNELDPINLYEDISSLKEKTDYVIVIAHGGKEYVQLPMPRMKRLYRHLIDLGADAVINHHQHCFSGYEVYNEKPIFYGLGNFCFDDIKKSKNNPSWKYGYCVRLFLDEKVDFELIPYIQGGGECVTITKRSPIEFKAEIDKLNAIIADDNKLREELVRFALKNKNAFLGGLWQLRIKLFSALYHRGLLGRFYNIKGLLNLNGRLMCESQLDILRLLVNHLIKSDKS